MTNITKYHEAERKRLIQYLEQYREVFERHKHLSLSKLAEELDRENIKTAKGYKWHKNSVSKALDLLNIPRRRW